MRKNFEMTPEEREIIRAARELTTKFILKCEAGRARSTETLTDCRTLIAMIAKWEDQKGKIL